MSRPRFATQVNFLDPKWTRDENGNEVPYGPIRLKELIKQCYMISKNCSTSYIDVLKITPIERDYLIGFIIQEAEETKKIVEDTRKKRLQE